MTSKQLGSGGLRPVGGKLPLCGVLLGFACSAPTAAESHEPLGSARQAFVHSDFPRDAWVRFDKRGFIWLDSNGSGAANSVRQTGPGEYEVVMPIGAPHDGVNNGGNVQVTADDAESPSLGNNCQVQSWLSNSAFVRCFNRNGPVDSSFSVHRLTFGQGSSYSWANDPTAASYTPAEFYQFQGSEVPLPSQTITHRSGPGQYSVNLPYVLSTEGGGSIATNHGSVVVTGYGESANFCTVAAWFNEAPNTRVEIRCFDMTGSPVDAKFSLSVMLFDPFRLFAFAYAERPTAADYIPHSHYQAAGWAGGEVDDPIRIVRKGAGKYCVYAVDFLGNDLPHDKNVRVSAAGARPVRCVVNSYAPACSVVDGHSPVTQVSCWGSSGMVDSRFVVQIFGPALD